MILDDSDSLENDRNNIVQRFNLGKPLLFVNVENAEVTLHRQQETDQLWCIKVRSGSGSVHPVEGGLALSEIGNLQIIYGSLPSGAMSAVASSEEAAIPVQVINDLFFLQTAARQRIKITFLTLNQEVIQTVAIPIIVHQQPNWLTRLHNFAQMLGIVHTPKRQVTYPRRSKLRDE